MSSLRYCIAAALVYLVIGIPTASPAATGVDIRAAIGSTNHLVRVTAVEHLLSDPEAGSRVLAYAAEAEQGEHPKLAVLAGAALGAVDIAVLLATQHAFVPAGSVPREVLSLAFLEKVRAIADLGGPRKKGGPTQPVARATPLGTHIAATITVLADDPNWRVRRIAAALLSEVASTRLTPSHNLLLRDAEWPVRLAAIRSLALASDEAARRELGRILKSSPGIEERVAAVRVLGTRGDVDAILEILRSETDDELHFIAISILARQPELSPAAIATIRSVATSTRNKYLRREIRRLLERKIK